MRITLGPNDTLLSIATKYTLSPAYAESIGIYNGMYGDDAGTTSYSVTSNIEWAGYVDIPNEWLKGQVVPDATQTTSTASAPLLGLGANTWIILAVAAAAIVFSGDTSPRRR